MWLDDGRVVGRHDLTTGRDSLLLPEYADLYRVSLYEWSQRYGVPWMGRPFEPRTVVPERGRFGWVWWRRRKAVRTLAREQAAHEAWERQHPAWRVPIDPPRGGWRDLVRNDPGEGLWRVAAARGVGDAPLLAVEARSWREGALGEQLVAGLLEQLLHDGSWRWVHSVPVGRGGADLDHVLVGPPGVVVVNTKHHAGARVKVGRQVIWVRGEKVDHVQKARAERARAERALARALGRPLSVRSALVYVHPLTVEGALEAQDPIVVSAEHLVGTLRALPEQLGPGEVSRVFGHVRRSTTWA